MIIIVIIIPKYKMIINQKNIDIQLVDYIDEYKNYPVNQLALKLEKQMLNYEKTLMSVSTYATRGHGTEPYQHILNQIQKSAQ